MDCVRVSAFAASLRRALCNRGLIQAATQLAPSAIAIETFELANIPPHNLDVEDAGEPPAVIAFKAAMAEADALLVVAIEQTAEAVIITDPDGRPMSRRVYAPSHAFSGDVASD